MPELTTNNQTTIAKIIARKIKPAFVKSPQGLLMFHVVQCALLDAARTIPKAKMGKKETITATDTAIFERDNARRYLSGYMLHCEISNVNSLWVHRIIEKAGLLLTIPKIEQSKVVGIPLPSFMTKNK